MNPPGALVPWKSGSQDWKLPDRLYSKKSRHRALKPLLAVVALAGLTGCVGTGISSYLATTEQEMKAARPETDATRQTVVVTEPVQVTELPEPQADAGNKRAYASEQSATVPRQTGTLESPRIASVIAAPALGDTVMLQPSIGTDPLPGTAITPQAGEIASLQPDATTSGFAIGTETTREVDPLEAAAELRLQPLSASIEHGQCKGGWGPKPKRMAAKRVTPGDPYYIEIRMRQTPLLPVGHTYVAYGRLDPFGEPVDEALIMLAPFGGYAGAALASGLPMPGVLTPHPDDCVIEPDAGYRISLSAQKYEMLLTEIAAAKADKPSYLLFTNNCNHFASRIAASVGIKPPKNIYVPALQYIYDKIEANEGVSVARR